MLQNFNTVMVYTLLFIGSDQVFNHPILLWAILMRFN